MPAFGDSAASAQPERYLEFRQAGTGNVGGLGRFSENAIKAASTFRSTLRRPQENSFENIVLDRSNYLAESVLNKEQDNPLPLPEPGTGVLLSIGLLSIFQLRSLNRHSPNAQPVAPSD
jgi:hypothetical protein